MHQVGRFPNLYKCCTWGRKHSASPNAVKNFFLPHRVASVERKEGYSDLFVHKNRVEISAVGPRFAKSGIIARVERFRKMVGKLLDQIEM